MVAARWRTRRRLAAAVAVVGLAAASLAACSSTPTLSRAAGRPNIVFILTDDLSTDLVQYMPHVLAMERAGMTLRNYFVVDSLCCPSRSTLFTGEYPHNDGVFTNSGSDGGYGAFNRHDDTAKTFALALQRAGYRTAMMGKYLNRYVPQDLPPRGWNEWDVAGFAYDEFHFKMNEDGFLHQYNWAPADYLTNVVSRRATAFIDKANRAQPFALEVATFAPHKPFVPARRDAHKFPGLTAPRGPAFDKMPTDPPTWLSYAAALSPTDVAKIDLDFRRRVQMVQAVDRMIGHLEHVLAAKGLLKNTYFVFSSDNGYHMGQHELMPGKQTAFDTDIRVPFVVTGPGVPAGATDDAMTASIDVAPTFEQIGGAKHPDVTDGASMLSMWHGGPPPPNWQQSVLIEHHGPPKDPDDPDIQSVSSGDPPSYEAIRTPDALYVEYADGEREYYNLVRDPYELHNLAGVEPETVLAPLQNALHALETCRGAPECQSAAQPA